MNEIKPTQFWHLFWLTALGLFIAICLFPISNLITRAAGLTLGIVVWLGLFGLYWRHRVLRVTLFGITLLCGGVLALPARHPPDAATLRKDYLTALRRYDGVSYYWGGENFNGIDCSGLIRRGLIDALFLHGIYSLDPGPVRQAFYLWWHDTTAKTFGQQPNEFTVQILDTLSVNQLDHSKILPGDLAVTSNGIHIMAYLGDNRWIEADPGIRRVITVTVPANENNWFRIPVNIVRWKFFVQ